MLKTGEILKNERKNKKLTIEDIEKTTKIRKKYIQAIEEGNWDIFPSATYIYGIIQSYSSMLKLDEEKLLAFFRREYEKREEVQFKLRASKSLFTSQTKKKFILTFSAILFVFFLYFLYQLYIYFSPPKFTIISPTRAVFKTEKVDLVGRTESDATVYVNGRQIFLDENSKFSVKIPLIQKKTTVLIEIIGANGRKTTVTKVFEKE